MRIGLGGACAQSQGDSTGLNRNRIWNDLIAGMTPQQILDDLAQNDSHHQGRQYGIVNMADEPVTFSGSSDGMAYYGVARVVDDIRYAIQGNVLTGVQVITNAEDAFLATKGDLSQKVIAAMEGARIFGGDGRCSCFDGAPMYCGCPPPHFTYSAYTAFFILARMGDVDGLTCDGATGCANGTYYCDLRSISGLGGQEPVLDLEDQYLAWRAGRLGTTDHIRTRVLASAGRLPADGVAQATVDVELRDIEGNLVTANPATLSIADVSGTPVAIVGAVQLVSPGIFRFPVTSTTTTGEGRWQITVHHPSQDVLLWPELVVAIAPPAELFAGFAQVSATGGALVPLWLDSGAAAAGQQYLILASASGTSPGTPFAGVQLPLNLDALMRRSYTLAGTGRFVATAGNLDANGRASAAFVASPNLLYPLLGRHVDWAAVVYGTPNHATVNDGFDVLP